MTFAPDNAWINSLPVEFQLPENQEEVKSLISERHRQIASVVNLKENAQYEDEELLTGQQWFTTGNNQTKRYTYRKCFEFGAIAAGATLNIAHGLTNVSFYTKIYGCCSTAVVDYRPIPYASTTAINQQIEINVAGLNIVIINGAASPNITNGIVVLEYIKL